jgi:His/Glu/Gln/Arg/opine family amino acid ABC transporter permease subunit
MSALEIIVSHRQEFLRGLQVTLQLCLIIWSVGIMAGMILGVAGARWKTVIGLPSRVLSFVLSGVPILVFLFWLYYPLQYALGVDISPFKTAAAALCIVNTFLVADVIRAVLLEFPEQYLMAARVCGLTDRETVLQIELPIVARQVLPSLLFVQVGMLQATLFASLISVEEIFRVAQRVNSEEYRPIQIYTALAFFFLAICLPLHGLAHYLKQRFTRNLSER